MPKRERLLTPIEILLVIGILAVLAGLVSSALDERSELRRASVCMSHLRELHGAFTMYAEDWNGAFPTNLPQTKRHFGWEYPWPVQTEKYLKDHTAFRCPDDTSDVTPALDSLRAWGHVTSYQMNQAIGWKHERTSGVNIALTTSDLPNPASTMLLTDREAWHFTRSRTDTRRNVLFADGHTMANADQQLMDTYWGQIATEPIPDQSQPKH